MRTISTTTRSTTTASTVTTPRGGVTDGRARRSITLGEAFGEFARWPSPRIIAALLGGAIVARSVVAGWTLVDLAVVVGMLGAQPFVEWVAHVVVLHARPRTLGPVTIDTLLARKHREHHAAPRELALVFIPTAVVARLAVGLVLVAVLAFPRVGLGLTFLVTIAAIGLAYEWTHYLVHTDYRPRRWPYRRLWTHHRLHHHKNEHYWFAITATCSDVAFRTRPDPSRVETSATVRDLLGRANDDEPVPGECDDGAAPRS